jgi:hypothetical protein
MDRRLQRIRIVRSVLHERRAAISMVQLHSSTRTYIHKYIHTNVRIWLRVAAAIARVSSKTRCYVHTRCYPLGKGKDSLLGPRYPSSLGCVAVFGSMTSQPYSRVACCERVFTWLHRDVTLGHSHTVKDFRESRPSSALKLIFGGAGSVIQ